jgi:hypothetical protein
MHTHSECNNKIMEHRRRCRCCRKCPNCYDYTRYFCIISLRLFFFTRIIPQPKVGVGGVGGRSASCPAARLPPPPPVAERATGAAGERARRRHRHADAAAAAAISGGEGDAGCGGTNPPPPPPPVAARAWPKNVIMYINCIIKLMKRCTLYGLWQY